MQLFLYLGKLYEFLMARLKSAIKAGTLIPQSIDPEIQTVSVSRLIRTGQKSSFLT